LYLQALVDIQRVGVDESFGLMGYTQRLVHSFHAWSESQRVPRVLTKAGPSVRKFRVRCKVLGLEMNVNQEILIGRQPRGAK